MSAARDWIRDLAGIGPADTAVVGNKAHRLARLLQAGFPVAPGFSVTRPAVAAWDTDRAAVEAALLAAYRRLGGGAVAVRSSAVEEDGKTASYAGVYHSEVPVCGGEALVAAVERCIASWHAPQAATYRQQLGHGDGAAMAILIQRLVPAVAAGTAYTRAPLDPARREIHIDAVWGLAEPLAAGRVSADSFVVSPRGRLLRQQITAKSLALGAEGPEAVPSARVDAPCLTPAQARIVAMLALRAETFFGAPQDVEFAFDGERAWLIQSRPITPLPAPSIAAMERYLHSERRRLATKCATLRRSGHLRGKEVVFSNGNIGELLPTPTMMSFGLFQEIFAGRHGAIVAGRQQLGYRFDAGAADHLYELVAGQACFNLEIDAATFDYGASPPVDHYIERVVAEPALANYPEVKLYLQQFSADEALACFGSDGQHAARQAAADFDHGLRTAAADFLRRYDDEIAPRIAATPAVRWAWLDAAGCARAIARQVRFLRQGPCVDFVVAARLGFYFAARLRGVMIERWGSEGEALCARLLTGLDGSLVTRQALWLEEVALGRRSEAEFLAAYGHTAPNELELTEPRLSEQPARLAAMLHDLALSGRRPASEFAHQQADRAAAEALISQHPALGGDGHGAFAETLNFAQRFLPLRETIKHHYTSVYADIRRGLLRMETLLGWPEGRIFHLRPRELAAATRDPRRLLARAEQRAAEHVLARHAARLRCVPSVVFGSRLAAIGVPESADTGTRWQGAPLSPGRRHGIARVLEPNAPPPTGDWHGDEILVLRAANLGLAPVFRMVAGVIVEVGGLLAHSACQAREAGIPAVALADATRLIADGAAISIDGATGAVALVESQSTGASHEQHPATV